MAITDAWLNPLTPGGSISALGYREDLEEFPHDLYSYFISSIRRADVKDVRLLWRWLYGMQLEWEHIYGKILNLPLLYSPDDCPEDFLEYFRFNVGITDDLDYLWGELDTNGKRRLIKYFVFFLMLRSTAYGFEQMIENMTGEEVEIYDFFDFRWLISGDSEYDTETALGREDLGYDPWLISEVNTLVGSKPDDVNIVTVGSVEYYELTITQLVTDTEATEPPVPELVRLSYRPTRVSYVAAIFLDGSDYKARAPADEYFGQLATPYNVDIEDFRVGFDSDPYTFDIRIVDEGDVNRDLMIAIARFGRPISERIYLRYYNMIDKFEDDEQWDTIAGTATHSEDDDTITLADAANDSIIRTNFANAGDWTDYSVSVKAQNTVVSKYFEIRFFWQDADNYLYIRMTPNAPPTIPAGTWTLGQVVATVDTPLDTGTFDWFDLDVDYFWRITCIEHGTDLRIQFMQDENLLSDDDYTTPWVDPKGQVELVGEANGEVVVSYMDLHPVPMESDYIGP